MSKGKQYSQQFKESGYLSWKNRQPSNTEQNRNRIKEKIKELWCT